MVVVACPPHLPSQHVTFLFFYVHLILHVHVSWRFFQLTLRLTTTRNTNTPFVRFLLVPIPTSVTSTHEVFFTSTSTVPLSSVRNVTGVFLTKSPPSSRYH